MLMKKIFWSLLFVSALFVSCGDDDDDDSNSSDNGGKKEVVDDGKITKDNCLDYLKKNYNLALQIPSTSTITTFSDFTYDWGISIKSENVKNDVAEMANSLFSQTQSVSKEGCFAGEYDIDEEAYTVTFIKGKDFSTLEDSKIYEVGGYYQYEWYYKDAKGNIGEVFISCDEENGLVGIAIAID